MNVIEEVEIVSLAVWIASTIIVAIPDLLRRAYLQFQSAFSLILHIHENLSIYYLGLDGLLLRGGDTGGIREVTQTRE